jgi:hypothetical protein
MTKDEALDLALEALEDRSSLMKWQKAITAIKQARSAPVQSAERGEPVWCGHCNGSGRMVRDPDIGTDQECFVCDGAGVPAAPAQEPVAECVWEHEDNDYMPGTWKSGCGVFWTFTDGSPVENDMKYCCGCGAKLKEKNT